MFEIKRYKEEIGELRAENSKIAATLTEQKREIMTEDEIQRCETNLSRIEELEAKITTGERLERMTSKTSRPLPEVKRYNDPKNKDLALRGWLLKGANPRNTVVDSDWVERAAQIGYTRDTISRTDLGQDLAMGHGSELTDGDIFAGLTKALKAYGGMRKVATIRNSSNANPIHYAYEDDTGNVASIVGENSPPTSVPVAYTKTPTLTGFTYKSLVAPISYEVIQDAMEDIIGDISGALGIRIGRRQNLDFTSGNGTGQPRGILLDATIGTTLSSVSAITYADVNTLFHSVDPDYRDIGDGKVCWMMNDATLSYLEQNLVDVNHRPLLIPGGFGNYADPTAMRILGYPIVINQQMPSVGAGTTPIAFGWFGSYVIRDVVTLIQIRCLRERYAEQFAVGLIGFARADGALRDVKAVKTLKMAASS